MIQDFKYALRSLTRSPIFAASAITTLALGIGVNSTIFTLANGALFRSMPGVSAPSELMWLSGMWRDTGRTGGLSYLEYLDYRTQTADVFSNVLAFAPSSFSVVSGGEPQRIRGHVVSGSYFSTLGVPADAGNAVAITDLLPLGGTMVSTVVAAREPGGGASESRAYMSSVGPDYFRTLEIPLVRGRGIGVGDRRGAPEVAIANETLARQLWSDLDPIGRTVKLDDRVVRIVGVARNAKYDEASEQTRPFLYLALAQHSNVDREAILVRASGHMTPAVLQQQIHALDPALPVYEVKPFEEVLRDRADKQRGIGALFGAFGVLALGLASLGLYGVMSYAVTRRTHEIGVRLALGATPHQLVRLIATDGLRLAITGVVIGTILGYPLARTLGALIFGVQIGDLATFAASGAVLVGVAMTAALLPARRAAQLDPMTALRVD